MRVAFIHSGYSQRLQSGIIRVETELVKELRRLGHSADIMPWDEDEQGSLVAQQYMRIVRPMTLIYKQIKDFIVNGNYDLVVFQGVGYPEARAIPWLKQETKARLIINQHGWTLHTPAARLLVEGYMQAVGHILLHEADAVLANSNYVVSHLAEFLEADKISLIYPGVDMTRFSPPDDCAKTIAAVRKKWNLRHQHILLGNGKLSSLKNYATVLRALPALPDAEFLLVGSGSTTKQEYYRQLASELGVSDRVHFLGTLPNEQLPELYGAADVFVHPSKTEALGIVLIESLACQTPVVVADVGGVRDVVVDGFNGLLFSDPKDHDALASRVRELLANPTRRAELGRNGRALVTAKFNWEKILPQYIAAFEKTLALSRAPAETNAGVFGAFA